MASRFLFLLTSKTFVVFVTNTSKKNLSAKISKTLTHFETIDQREQFVNSSPSSTENVRNSVRIPRSRGGKNKGGKRLHLSVPLCSLSAAHRKWFCFSSAAKTMGILRYTRATGRWKERRERERKRGRAASAVTAVTPVILLYAGNKCAPLTHASAIPAFSSILVRPRAPLPVPSNSPLRRGTSLEKKKGKEGKK